MTHGLKLSLAAAAALTLAGCGSGAGHADTAKAADDIKAFEAQWNKDYASKDVSALAGKYTEDAAIASPGDPLATSGADRRKGIQGLTSDPNFALTFSTDRVLVANSGELASSRGHYSITMTDKASGKPVTSGGSYLTVYKKEDGGWKAVEDFITPGPAPAPAAAAK